MRTSLAKTLLVSLALAVALSSAVIAIGRHRADGLQRADAVTLDQLKLRHDQARWRCNGEPRCMLASMYPGSAQLAERR